MQKVKTIIVALLTHTFRDVTALFCTTKRHVHLSIGKDSSKSAIISFSSLPCDLPDSEKWAGKSFKDIVPRHGGVLVGKDQRLRRFVKAKDPIRYNAKIYHKTKDATDYWSEYQYHTKIDNLEPNTVYYYRCVIMLEKDQIEGDDDYSQSSKDQYRTLQLQDQRKLRANHTSESHDAANGLFWFKTGPVPGRDEIARMAIIGDLGVFDHTRESLDMMSNDIKDIDFIALVGDISYANGNHKIWDQWFDMIDDQHYFRSKPLLVAAGNHDVEGDKTTGDIFTAYEHRFLMPQIAPARLGQASKKDDYDLNKMYQLPYDYGNSFYSYKYGPSHNIVLNSFADFESGSVQYEWLVNELEKRVDREVTPWLTVTTHCPMYNTFSKHQGDPQPVNLKRYIEPLITKHHVNFVLSGHIHAYMRTKPVINGTVTSTGPIHVILGNGGREANAPYQKKEAEEWVAIRDHTTYGYGIIEFLNASVAMYQWIHTGHNKPEDKGKHFLDIPENLTDSVFVPNQYFLT